MSTVICTEHVPRIQARPKHLGFWRSMFALEFEARSRRSEARVRRYVLNMSDEQLSRCGLSGPEICALRTTGRRPWLLQR